MLQGVRWRSAQPARLRKRSTREERQCCAPGCSSETGRCWYFATSRFMTSKEPRYTELAGTLRMIVAPRP